MKSEMSATGFSCERLVPVGEAILGVHFYFRSQVPAEKAGHQGHDFGDVLSLVTSGSAVSSSLARK